MNATQTWTKEVSPISNRCAGWFSPPVTCWEGGFICIKKGFTHYPGRERIGPSFFISFVGSLEDKGFIPIVLSVDRYKKRITPPRSIEKKKAAFRSTEVGGPCYRPREGSPISNRAQGFLGPVTVEKVTPSFGSVKGYPLPVEKKNLPHFLNGSRRVIPPSVKKGSPSIEKKMASSSVHWKKKKAAFPSTEVKGSLLPP